MGLDPGQRFAKLFSVVDAGAEYDLSMNLDARLAETLKHLDPAVRVAADE